ncbi:hypothetical protein CWI38_1131p0020 [Hamiltosporidium tvaerminnensis]|uniref:Uncharacterized protein n=1 Tax=Hamiltosporidium tvaerminnensis TaxID=1176355 RepID=A0A4Q9LTF7_9MICR|nr:hypothetical protein CWI38_1131p0020 [Hamiltosporidium tvaerminnensis]
MTNKDSIRELLIAVEDLKSIYPLQKEINLMNPKYNQEEMKIFVSGVLEVVSELEKENFTFSYLHNIFKLLCENLMNLKGIFSEYLKVVNFYYKFCVSDSQKMFELYKNLIFATLEITKNTFLPKGYPKLCVEDANSLIILYISMAEYFYKLECFADSFYLLQRASELFSVVGSLPPKEFTVKYFILLFNIFMKSDCFFNALNALHKLCSFTGEIYVSSLKFDTFYSEFIDLVEITRKKNEGNVFGSLFYNLQPVDLQNIVKVVEESMAVKVEDGIYCDFSFEKEKWKFIFENLGKNIQLNEENLEILSFCRFKNVIHKKEKNLLFLEKIGDFKSVSKIIYSVIEELKGKKIKKTIEIEESVKEKITNQEISDHKEEELEGLDMEIKLLENKIKEEIILQKENIPQEKTEKNVKNQKIRTKKKPIRTSNFIKFYKMFRISIHQIFKDIKLNNEDKNYKIRNLIRKREFEEKEHKNLEFYKQIGEIKETVEILKNKLDEKLRNAKVQEDITVSVMQKEQEKPKERSWRSKEVSPSQDTSTNSKPPIFIPKKTLSSSIPIHREYQPKSVNRNIPTFEDFIATQKSTEKSSEKEVMFTDKPNVYVPPHLRKNKK